MCRIVQVGGDIMDNPFNEISDICEKLDVIGKGLDDVLEKQTAIIIAVKEIHNGTKNVIRILDKTIERHEENMQIVKK